MQRQIAGTFDSGRISYTVKGDGPSVLFIHGSLPEVRTPLFCQPGLTDEYRLIAYDRRGYGMSAPPVSAPTMSDHATDARDLLVYLSIERAHIVGHSYGGNIAMQVAVDFPDLVDSLTLLEPALPSVVMASEQVMAAFGQIFARFQAGDLEGAFDGFMSGFVGPDYRAQLEAGLPAGSVERSIPGIATTLQYDFPALQEWTFGAEEASAIRSPVLLVHGQESGPIFEQIDEQTREWFPRAEHVLIPGANHLTTLLSPTAVATAMTRFFAAIDANTRAQRPQHTNA